MTPGDPAIPDSELVPRVLDGDREAFAQVYDRYADRLFDFAHSMLRNREDAADAVADAFVTTAEKLAQLRNPERLRPWLYSVVRRECLRRLRERSKLADAGEERLVDMADDRLSPGEAAEQEELRTLVWDAAAGLGERDRALLDLHLRHGLEGAELGEAMGVTANNAYVMLNRLRTQVERSLGALLIARLGRDECVGLGELLRGWDGRFSPLIRKRVARHVDKCQVCSQRRSTMVSPWTLLSDVPLLAAPAGLRSRVLGDPRLVAFGLGPAGASPAAPALDPKGGRRERVARGTVVAVVVAALAALAILIAIVWPERSVVVRDPSSSMSRGTPAAPTSAPVVVPGATVSPEPRPSPEQTSAPSTPPSPTASPTPTTATPTSPSSPPTTTATPDRPPQIGEITIDRVASDCTVEVAAPIADDSAVASTTVAWETTRGGSGTTEMAPSAQEWRANLGGMQGGQEIAITITAVDDAGQQATRSATAPLEYCVF